MWNKRKLVGLLSNALIVLLVVMAVNKMVNTTSTILAGMAVEGLKYFTVLSNIFEGLIALASVIYFLFFDKKKYPRLLGIMKLVSTTAVSLTLITVFVYLTPLLGLALLLQDANFYMHLVIPLLAIIEFIFLEQEKVLIYRHNLYAVIPMLVYGVGYLSNVAAHNAFYGNLMYDWYGFGMFGPGIGVLMFIMMLAMTFAISNGLYFAYRARIKAKKKEQ